MIYLIIYLMAAFLFAIAWPIIIYYLVGLLMKRGVIKYKGRVIWKATK